MSTAVPYLIICFFFGVAGGIVGRIKGASFFLWFLISAIIPFFGLLAAVLSRNDRIEEQRRCPRCGRVLKLHDQLCFGCGLDLDFPLDWSAQERPQEGREAPR